MTKIKIINPKGKPLPSKITIKREKKIDIFTKPKRKRLVVKPNKT
jgi:hypothetical protein